MDQICFPEVTQERKNIFKKSSSVQMNKKVNAVQHVHIHQNKVIEGYHILSCKNSNCIFISNKENETSTNNNADCKIWFKILALNLQDEKIYYENMNTAEEQYCTNRKTPSERKKNSRSHFIDKTSRL